MDLTGARCATHAEQAADGTCERCGLFVCERCRSWYAQKPLCTRCHAVAMKEKPSRQAVAALVFATLGFCGFVPGVLALYLGHRELQAIRAGRAPSSGEGFALLARNLGFFHLAMALVCAIGLAARMR